MVAAWDHREGAGGVTANGEGVSLGSDKNGLNLDLVRVAQFCEFAKTRYTVNGWILWSVNAISKTFKDLEELINAYKVFSLVSGAS